MNVFCQNPRGKVNKNETPGTVLTDNMQQCLEATKTDAVAAISPRATHLHRPSPFHTINKSMVYKLSKFHERHMTTIN